MTRFKFLSDAWGFFSEPFELLLAGVQIMAGTLFIFGHQKPGPLEAQLPSAELKTWVVGYLIGGIIVVLARLALAMSCTERSLEAGSRVEAVGLTISGGALTMYAISIYALGFGAFPSGSILAAWALAAFLRTLAIRKMWAPYRKARRRKEKD